MQWLGEIALHRGLSQEELARKLRERFKVKLNGANVYAHFVASRPQRETILRYANILDVTAEQLHVAEYGTLPAGREDYWESEVFRQFRFFKASLEPGTVEAIADALQVKPRIRSRALAAFVVAQSSPPPNSLEWDKLLRLPLPLVAFAEALYPQLDLRDFAHEYSVGESTLLLIYGNARALYDGDGERALAFVKACAAILEFDGFDTQPMFRPLYDRIENDSTFRGAFAPFIAPSVRAKINIPNPNQEKPR